MNRDDAAELIAAGVRGDVPALRRLGVSFRPPWWRRQIQSVLAPARYRRWVQREALRQLEDARGA